MTGVGRGLSAPVTRPGGPDDHGQLKVMCVNVGVSATLIHMR